MWAAVVVTQIIIANLKAHSININDLILSIIVCSSQHCIRLLKTNCQDAHLTLALRPYVRYKIQIAIDTFRICILDV